MKNFFKILIFVIALLTVIYYFSYFLAPLYFSLIAQPQTSGPEALQPAMPRSQSSQPQSEINSQPSSNSTESISKSNLRQVKMAGQTFYMEVADTTPEQVQGLSGRPAISQNSGMIFIFAKPGNYGFWMKDMLFSLDMIWLRGHKVIYMVQNLFPDNSLDPVVYSSGANAEAVIEVLAGTIRRLGLKIGDVMDY